MVKISLQMKANLQNVTDVRATGEDFRWYLKVRCVNCGEESDSFVYACQLERTAIQGSRGDANLVIKCKLCSRVNNLEILPDSVKPYKSVTDHLRRRQFRDELLRIKSIQARQQVQHAGGSPFQSLVTFECRGLEITDFSPRSGFACVGEESGSKFDDVDLTEKEWCDYDERAGESVAIDELEFQFVRA